MTSKELRLYLKEKFKIHDQAVFMTKWNKTSAGRKAETIAIPSYRVLDWLQEGYELGKKEAQAKSQI